MINKEPTGSPDPERSQAEIDHLLRHLAETEQALQALIKSQVENENDPQRAVLILINQAQEYIKETNQVLANLLSGLSFGVAYLDCDYNFIWVNPLYARAAELDQNDFVGKNYFDLFPGTEAQGLFQRVVDNGLSDYHYGVPFRFPRFPERGLTYWNWSVQPVKNAAGKVTGILLTTVDVTEQKRTELALQEQTKIVRLLQDIAVAANEAASVNAALQFALDRVCDFTGWPVGHAIENDPQRGLVTTRLWHLDDPDKRDVFRLASETRDWNTDGGLPSRIVRNAQADWVSDLQTDLDFSRKDAALAAGLRSCFTFPLLVGREVVGVLEFFSEVYAVPQEDLLQVMGHIGTQLGRVIERERNRYALQRSESRFRAIFEESTIGILLNTPEGHFIEINPAMQVMLGYTAEELFEIELTELIHPDDLERNLKYLNALLRGERTHYNLETRYVRKDGSILWAHLAVSLISDPENTPQFIVTLVVDVSARKRMEAELSEVQGRLQESIEAERLRLAMELHDGPLQDLYGATFQLQEVLPFLPDPGSANVARNAQSIIQQVISSLRSTVGELRPPTLIPFGLEKAIRSHMERWRQIYPALNIHLELMSDGTSLSESGRLALFRAYQQLISNVARHSNAGNMWVRLKLDPADVVLEVQDDGAGFNLPERWVELAREGHAGLIGISERMESFGGSLWLESVPGHGTLARLIIPRERIKDQRLG